MKTNRKYIREIKRQFGYLATWLPGTPIELGDVGVLKRNQFTKIANLSDFNIQFEIEEDTEKVDLNHSSKNAVSVTTKASGTISPQGSTIADADAGITVDFHKQNAILFKANGTTTPSIKNQVKLGKQIIKLYKEGKWDKDWAVITEKVDAESGTIIISSSSNAKVELNANADVKASKLDIADASIGLGISFSKDVSTIIIAKEGLTPLLRASKVKGRIFGAPVFRANGIRTMDFVTPNKVKTNEDLVFFGEAEFEEEEED